MVDRLMEAEAEITRLHQERERWIDYTTDLQRIIEALCDRRGLPEPVSTARHHYNMAREHLAAERLAGARVKALDEDDYEEITNAAGIAMRRASRGIRGQVITVQDSFDWWVMKETERRILSALAEPAGEAEPVACDHSVSRSEGETICVTCGSQITTPPDASAIRGALEAIRALSGLDGELCKASATIMSRMADIHQTADAALAGAKP